MVVIVVQEWVTRNIALPERKSSRALHRWEKKWLYCIKSSVLFHLWTIPSYCIFKTAVTLLLFYEGTLIRGTVHMERLLRSASNNQLMPFIFLGLKMKGWVTLKWFSFLFFLLWALNVLLFPRKTSVMSHKYAINALQQNGSYLSKEELCCCP